MKTFKDVVIHIGLHKSGSTFLQKEIFPKLDCLFLRTPELDALFADKRDDSDRDVRYRFKKLGKKIISDIENRTNQIDVEYLHDKAINVTDKRLLISQEHLCGNDYDRPGLDKFEIADKLHLLFPNARIIFIVRNQYDYIRSLYAYRVLVKGFEYRSFERYLEDLFYCGFIEKLKYNTLVDYYYNLFGKKNVLVLPYEKLKHDFDKYIQTIVHFIDAESSMASPAMNRVLNKSDKLLTLLAVNLIGNRLVGAFFRAWRSVGLPKGLPYRYSARLYFYFKRFYLNPLIRFFCNERSQSLAFSKKWDDIVIKSFRESNQILMEMTDQDLKFFNYPL